MYTTSSFLLEAGILRDDKLLKLLFEKLVLTKQCGFIKSTQSFYPQQVGKCV